MSTPSCNFAKACCMQTFLSIAKSHVPFEWCDLTATDSGYQQKTQQNFGEFLWKRDNKDNKNHDFSTVLVKGFL